MRKILTLLSRLVVRLGVALEPKPQPETIVRVCAWCYPHAVPPPKLPAGIKISHGICEKHFKEMTGQLLHADARP